MDRPRGGARLAGPTSIWEPLASTHDQLKEGELPRSDGGGPSPGPPANRPATCPLPSVSSPTRKKMEK